MRQSYNCGGLLRQLQILINLVLRLQTCIALQVPRGPWTGQNRGTTGRTRTVSPDVMVLIQKQARTLRSMKLTEPMETFRTILYPQNNTRLLMGAPVQDKSAGNLKYNFFTEMSYLIQRPS